MTLCRRRRCGARRKSGWKEPDAFSALILGVLAAGIKSCKAALAGPQLCPKHTPDQAATYEGGRDLVAGNLEQHSARAGY